MLVVNQYCGGRMKKILLIDDSDTYIWCLQKYLQRRGYPAKTASTLQEARTVIQEEMPLVPGDGQQRRFCGAEQRHL